MAENFIEHFRYYINTVAEDSFFKTFLSLLLVFIGYVQDFTGLSIVLYILLTVVMALDIVFGIIVAIKQDSFDVDKLKKWVSKFITYGLCIGLFSAMDYSLTMGSYHVLAQLVASIIMITEIISILNHCVALNMPVPPLVNKLARGAQKKIENKIDDFVDENQDENSN